MARTIFNYIRLGLFVIAGMVFLVVLLYFIGKNRNIFHPSFLLKTHFQHIQGLQPGNNVRYAGIQAGAVKTINILNDTLIEVVLDVDNKFKNIIRQNALVSIGNDGFVGNKIVNIEPVKEEAAFVEEGYLLVSKEALDTDAALRTLSNTNRDIADIAHELKTLLTNINRNPALVKLVTSDEIPNDIKAALADIRKAARQLQLSATEVNKLLDSVSQGKGSLGAILQDTVIYANLLITSEKIKLAGEESNRITRQVSQVVQSLKDNIDHGKGPVQAILRDSSMTHSLQNSLDNIEKGTSNFSQNMEALKSNFLFRGYFRKLDKKEKKDSIRATKE